MTINKETDGILCYEEYFDCINNHYKVALHRHTVLSLHHLDLAILLTLTTAAAPLVVATVASIDGLFADVSTFKHAKSAET